MTRQSNLFAAGIAALGLIALGAQSANAQTAYVIGAGGFSLLSFNLATPGTVTSVALSGPLEAIDFRPLTGQLYGYSDGNDALYTINTTTGALTQVGASNGNQNTNGTQYGLDFNPTIDMVRVVNDSVDPNPATNANNNLVYNPNAIGSTPTIANELIYATGDANFGVAPSIGENAYTNSFAGANSTVQYGIDYNLGNLVTIGNNAGTLSTVASLKIGGIAIGPFASNYIGFDIFGASSAYVLLNGDSAPTLYSLNLGTGDLTSVGAIGTAGTPGNRYSLAIAPAVTVPEAGTLPLLMGGVMTAGLGIVVRRRVKK